MKSNPDCRLLEIAQDLNVKTEDISEEFSSLLEQKYIAKKKKFVAKRGGGSTSYQVYFITAKGLSFMSQASTKENEEYVNKVGNKKIFISHTYDDRKIAIKIIDILLIPVFNLNKERDIFFTSRRATGIKSSLNWRTIIKSSIKETDIFIALITPNFRKSEMCQNELGAAWVGEKYIFPVIVPPITFDNFSDLIAELQADIITNKENVESFMMSIASVLIDVYKIDYDADIIEECITKFTRSLNNYLKRNPKLFSQNFGSSKKQELISSETDSKNIPNIRVL